ncbi:MAG: DUF4388 domain-containing protein [Deltaproteobacteria bacterium]|nr:DUF4388 domain-containing protein [Deltaproteobacteria bacterium]
MNSSSGERYQLLRRALVQVRHDLGAVRELLTSEQDQGAWFLRRVRQELCRELAQGNVREAEINLEVAMVLGNMHGVLMRNADYRAAIEAVGAVCGRDYRGGLARLDRLVADDGCDRALRWIAGLWMASAAIAIGDLSYAKQVVSDASKLSDPNDPFAVGTTARVSGEVFNQAGDRQAALRQLRRAVDLLADVGNARDQAMACLSYGRALIHDEPEKGRASAERAASLDPGWIEPRLYLCRLALSTGQLDDAEEQLKQIAQRCGKAPGAIRESRLLALLRDGQLSADLVNRYLKLCARVPSETLVTELVLLCEIHRDFLELRELLAWTLLHLGRDDEAAKELEALAIENLDGEMHASVLLGIGCLASRRSAARQPGAWIPESQRTEKISASALQALATHQAIPAIQLLDTKDTKQEEEDKTDRCAVFTGQLALLNVPELLEFLKVSRRSGTLVITSEQGIGAVQLRDGMVTGAASPTAPHVGELLVEQGLVAKSLVEEIAKSRRESRLIGAELISRQLVSLEQVKAALSEQSYMAIAEMIHWQTGRFAFEPEGENTIRTPVDDNAIEIVLDPQMLVLEALRRFDEQNR